MQRSSKIIILMSFYLIFSCITIEAQIPHPFSTENRNVFMNISTNISETEPLYGGNLINVNYSIYNTHTGVFNVKGEIKIPPYFSDMTPVFMDDGYKFAKDYNKIIIDCDINKNKYINCSYDAIISCNPFNTLGEIPKCEETHSISNTTIDPLYWHWDYKGINGRLIISNDSNLTIKNDMPELNSRLTKIIVEEPVLYLSSQSKKQDTLIAFEMPDKPFNATFCVDVKDRENENLTYIWRYKESSNRSEYIDIEFPGKYTHNCIYDISELIEPEKKYSFYVSAEDPRNSTSKETQVNISYLGDDYSYIYNSSSHPIIPVTVYIFILIILLVIGYFRDPKTQEMTQEIVEKATKKISLPSFLYKSYDIILRINSLLNAKISAGCTIIIITFIYLFIYYRGYEILYPLFKYDELMVYPKSLSLFEFWVYLVVFILIVYFTEACFGQKETVSSKRLATVSWLWLVNSVFMLVILLSLDALILRASQLDTQEWLQNYYGEMGEIFATILAIIAAFYTAIPKNILSFRRNGFRQEQSHFHYRHTRILHYFLGLYGVIVALSIYGFSVGLTAEFPPLVELNPANLFNLASIFVFETTLLLVPPAITCLYELLRSMLFTGNIKLNSKPAGAKIFVDGHDTRLVTPNMIMLSEGTYKISIRKIGYKDYKLQGQGKDGDVDIYAGTEQDYECILKEEDFENPFKS